MIQLGISPWEISVTENNDPLVAIYNKIAERHGRGRNDVRFLAQDVFSSSGECQSVAELQSLLAAQMAGLIEGLVDYDVLDNADKVDGILLSVMRSVANR